jgi:BirA family biotin operon repressor/biotin-[acetyl-CoA-carboxylase] ligase
VAGAGALGPHVDATELVAGFLRAFHEGYRPAEAGFAVDVTSRWREVAATLGRRVSASRLDGERIVGVAIDIDASGGLVIETDRGREVVMFGELEHLD